ncbi:MAG: alcohol dehydrogenase catalytic domain-containing protein [Nocardioidaceae bacterium]
MRAISFSEYGGPEVLREVDVDSPEPRADQVRVQVRAAGVNPFDCKLRAGAFAGQIRLRLPHVPGAEVAGVVDAVGRDVAGTQVGDPVFGWAKSGATPSGPRCRPSPTYQRACRGSMPPRCPWLARRRTVHWRG